MTDDELADLKRDNAERKARRRAGQEPELWQPPEREAVRAAPSINVAVIFEHISAETAKLYKHVEKQSCLVAEAIGAETGKNESELRKSINRSADELRLEMKQGFGRHATELMKLREIRESAQSD